MKTLVRRRGYWSQQDGAPCRCITANLNFLSDKFNGRLISRRRPFPWPTHSYDLSPLEYWLRNELESEKYVYISKQNNIQELKEVVEKYYSIRESIPIFLNIYFWLNMYIENKFNRVSSLQTSKSLA